jgi:hypothetical protein
VAACGCGADALDAGGPGQAAMTEEERKAARVQGSLRLRLGQVWQWRPCRSEAGTEATLVRARCNDVQAEEGRLRHTGESGPRMRAAWACAGAMLQGRGERGPGNRRKRSNCAGQRCAERRRAGRRRAAHGGVPAERAQAMTGWCAGRSCAVREELQCGGYRRIRAGAVEPRMEDVGGR